MIADPPGVLALHVGVRTGWAYGSAGDAPKSGTWRLSVGTDHGEIGAALFDAMGDHCKIMRPTRIVLSSGIIDPGAEDAADLAGLAIGMTFAVRVFGVRKSLPVRLFSPYDIREHYFPGTRAGFDAKATAWCRKQGFDPKLAPAAHALLLWTFALEPTAP